MLIYRGGLVVVLRVCVHLFYSDRLPSTVSAVQVGDKRSVFGSIASGSRRPLESWTKPRIAWTTLAYDDGRHKSAVLTPAG